MAYNLERDYENEYESLGKVDKTRMRDTRYKGVFWPSALCLGVMCILQATLNITLRLHSNPEPETELLSTISNNMTIDKLQVIYTNLVKERDQLQTRYTSVAEERDQLQTRYTSVAEERDQLRKKKSKLENMFPELVDIIRLGGKYFRSSIYYISAEKKSWGQSRRDCIKRGADLVIIDSQEEKDFITEQLGNKSQAWVGLISKDTDEEWKWVDGTALNTGYWKIPSKTNNVGNISGGQNWVVTPCDHVEWWVCEIKVFE